MLENLTFCTTSKHGWSNPEQFSPTCTALQNQDFGPTALCAAGSPRGAAWEQTGSRTRSAAFASRRLLLRSHARCLPAVTYGTQASPPLSDHRVPMTPVPSSLLSVAGRRIRVSVGFSQCRARLCSSPAELHGLLFPTASAAARLSLASAKPCSSLSHFGTWVHLLHLSYVAKDVNNLPHVLTKKQVTSRWNC